MLKTCFGCSTLRSGVNVVAVVNMIFILGELFFRCIFHLHEYLIDLDQEIQEIYSQDDHEIQTTPSYDQKPKPTTLVTWEDHKFTSALIYIMWTVLILITNIGLKKATFSPATRNIYAWLVIKYFTLLCLVIHLINYITLLKHTTVYKLIFRVHDSYVGSVIMNLLFVVIYIFEIIIVHSYYIEEQKAMLNDVIQLKWKHVSKGHVLSQGTAHPSASTFNESVSRQTQKKFSQSKIPSFITNVLLERA